MTEGDARLVARGCQKSAVCSLAAYSVNMAETDESQKYRHTKADDLQTAPVVFDALLGAVRTPYATPPS